LSSPAREDVRAPDPLPLLTTWERGTREDPLERALTLVSAATGLTRDEAAATDVGSREVLLARLLTTIAGGLAWAGAACGGCGEQLDVPVDLAAVARLPVHERGERFHAAVDGGAVSFRLPTTADLRMLPAADPVEGRRILLARCVGRPSGEISDLVAAAVEAAMERVSPGGAVEVVIGCPTCATATTAALDVTALLWPEIEARALALMADVHALATAYGWTETDVLGLSPQRRAVYLTMVDR